MLDLLNEATETSIRAWRLNIYCAIFRYSLRGQVQSNYFDSLRGELDLMLGRYDSLITELQTNYMKKEREEIAQEYSARKYDLKALKTVIEKLCEQITEAILHENHRRELGEEEKDELDM